MLVSTSFILQLNKRQTFADADLDGNEKLDYDDTIYQVS